MTHRYLIACDIRTTAPLHITALEKGSYDPQSQRRYRYDGPGIGATLTRSLALAHKASVRMATQGEEAPDNAQGASSLSSVQIPRVPVVPASTIAGKLRRAAAELLYESLLARKLQLKPAAFNTLNAGTATTSLNPEAKTADLVRIARDDAFLGLFGGTTFALAAGSVIAEGWPITADTEQLLMSPRLVEASPLSGMNDLTEMLAIVRKNDLTGMSYARLDELLGVQAVTDALQTDSSNRAESKARRKAGEDGTKTDLRTLNAIEAVRAGVPFALRVRVDAPTPHHLGLMLLALQRLLRDGQLGGRGARSWGSFVCEASRLYQLSPGSARMEPLCQPFGDRTSDYALADHPVLQRAEDAAQAYLADCTPARYNAFAEGDVAAITAMAEA